MKDTKSFPFQVLHVQSEFSISMFYPHLLKGIIEIDIDHLRCHYPKMPNGHLLKRVILRWQYWGKYKAQQWIETIKNMNPGVAMMIVHSSDITEEFKYVSGSGGSRLADMNSMMNPDLRAYIEKEGIILTTFRELLERRKKLK